MAEEWRFVGEAEAADLGAVLPDRGDDLDDVVDVALGVGAARDGEADEVHFGDLAEHEGSDFYGADAAFEIEFGGESYAGKLIQRDVRDEAAGVKVDGVASGRHDEGDSLLGEVVSEVGGGGDAVTQVVFVTGLLQADGDGFEIASGEASVGGVAFGEDEQVFFLLGKNVIVGAEESADVGHAVFLGAHGAAVAEREHLLGDLFGRFVFKAGLAELDEVGVFSEAASVKVKRDVVGVAELADLAGVFHGDGLASAGVVGDGEHDKRNALGADALDGFGEGGDIHVAFEWMDECGLLAFSDDEVEGFGSGGFDVGASGIEVSVVGDNVSGLEDGGEEDALGGASLVSGDDVLVAEDALHGVSETDVAAASGVTFIAFHDGSPLVGGHGSGAGVGEEIDEDVIGGHEKEIVVGVLEETLAVSTLRPVDGLDTLDAKWLDDGADGHDGLLAGDWTL